MNGKSKWLRKGLQDIVRVRDSYEDRSKMYRMDRNERTWPISEDILEEIRNKISSDILTNYTEVESTYCRLADYLGVRYEQIYLHSGSDLVIKSIFETYIEKGDKVLIQNPSYAMYTVYGRMYGANLHEWEFDEKLSFSIDDYCKCIEKEKPKLAVLENPGGYVGNGFSHEDVRKFIETSYECDSLAVVDEAYIDFIPEASVVDLIDKYDNLIVVRTFSKAWGLAGLRAGYAVSNEMLISELFKVRPMHELTSFTSMVVETMLDHMDEVRTYIDEVKCVREYFCGELDSLGIRFADSSTHFVTACIGEKMDAEIFRSRAHQNGFYVRRPFGQSILKNWVRIGLLPVNEMRSFVTFLQSMQEDNQG
jgi:histidinol-phosphate aminotransferase